MKTTISSDYEKSIVERDHDRLCDIARSDAVSYIGLYKKSSGKIAGWLIKKGYPAYIVDEVINTLIEENVIDDEELSRKYIANRPANKQESANSTAQRLIRLGIPTDIAYKSVSESINNNDYELLNAITLVRLKFSSKIDTIHELAKGDADNQKMKIFRFLLNRGYSREIALSAINNVLKDNFLNDE